MATLATVELKITAHVWMYGDKWRVVVEETDDVEVIAESIEADRRGLI